MTEPSSFESNPQRARAWLSRGLPELFDRHYQEQQASGSTDDRPPHFDVLIVGSGYGGAVAAASLAGCHVGSVAGPRLRIAVFERGDEYLPGSFPAQLSELPGHVRFSLPGAAAPSGARWGLFDVRIGADVVTVVANGLGGGSLINAGVMLEPRRAVLKEAPWPSAIRRDPTALDTFYERAMLWLGAGTPRQPNTVAAAGMALEKFDVMERLGGGAVPITVALRSNVTSSAGVAMRKCVACGDCAMGCNHEAKNSLDVNLLVHAWRHGVKIYTGATVLRLEKSGERWLVVVNHTDPALRQRQKVPLRIAADKVILAAGTFGSTEILKRSCEHGLRLSGQVGKRFSANGDLFAAAYDTKRNVNGIADETVRPDGRKVGPTVTASVDGRNGNPETDFSIQELAVPGPLRRLFVEIFTTARTLHSLGKRDCRHHTSEDADRNAVDPAAFDRTVPLVLIGRDGADGELELAGNPTEDVDDLEGDGAVHVRWPQLKHDPRFDKYHDRTQRLLVDSGVGGDLLPSPAWKLQPDDAAQILGIDRGPLLTVHPLGGCPMGDDATSGAVNDVGQVFTGDPAQPRDVHPGLVVLDGSIVPTSLGINPALTIAALALRAIETLMSRWGLCPDPGLGERASTANTSTALVRPMFRKLLSEAAEDGRQPQPSWIVPPVQTEVQLIERLRGFAKLADGNEHHLEFTLHSSPVAVASLMSRTGPRRIHYDLKRSVLRVFNDQPSPLDDDPRDLVQRRPDTPRERKRAHLEARAQVAGSLDVLRLVPTRYPARTLRALVAWFQHRGLRDWVQWLAEKVAGLEPPADPMKPAPPGWGERLWRIHDIATRAGTALSLDYRLELHELETAPGVVPEALFGSRALRQGEVFNVDGQKRLTYDGRSSPWQQLMELTLDRFPGMPPRESALLTLDLPYLGRQGVPLLRVVRQHDHIHALVDLAAFHLYVLRTVFDGHMWSFRRPDRVPGREVNLLPGATPDLLAPEVTRIVVDEVKGKPVPIQLTRYRPTQSLHRLPPVLLIHGYSASGTTFVHSTLPGGGLVGRLVRNGRDTWVLDLRSSAGMPWATHEWSFEHIGREDIPMAMAHIVATCGGKVDVVAHCMGAAMLCMALLGDIPKHAVRGDRYPDLREAMRDRIRRIVLSQVGPVVMMSPSNQARAFVMRYVRQLLPMAAYQFRPEGEDSLVDNLLDRLVATLPYPADEFRRENPLWPPWASRPWVQTRRRMDALYGQTFKLTNLSDRTLEHLDDFFGPMSVATASQVIHFTRSRAITDERGRHVFATADRLRERLAYPILSIHGTENGLVDVSTADLLKEALDSPHHKVELIKGFGHQDCLIGENPAQAFDAIATFLGRDL